jgi:hypothetical protein
MRRNLAMVGTTRRTQRTASSVACLAFVILMSLAFWAGAAWIAEFLIRLSTRGY